MAAKWLKDTVFYEIYPQSFKDTNSDGKISTGSSKSWIILRALAATLSGSIPATTPLLKMPVTTSAITKKWHPATALMKIFTVSLTKPMRRVSGFFWTWSPATLPRSTPGLSKARRQRKTNTPTASSGRISASTAPAAFPTSAVRAREAAAIF